MDKHLQSKIINQSGWVQNYVYSHKRTDNHSSFILIHLVPFKTIFLLFGEHKSLLWRHWYPCFGLMVTSLGFKARVGRLIHAWQSYIFPAGVTPANLFHSLPCTSDQHWWNLRLEFIMSLPHSVWPGRCSTDWAMTARLSKLTSAPSLDKGSNAFLVMIKNVICSSLLFVFSQLLGHPNGNAAFGKA